MQSSPENSFDPKAIAEALGKAFVSEAEDSKEILLTDAEQQNGLLTKKPAAMKPNEWVKYILKNNLPPPSKAKVFVGRKSGNFPTGVSYWATERSMAEHYSKGGTTGQIKDLQVDPTVFEADITPRKTLDMLRFDHNTRWVDVRAELIRVGVEKSDLEEWFPNLTDKAQISKTVFDQQLWPNAPRLLNALRALGYDAIRIDEGHEEAYVVLDPDIIQRIADYKIVHDKFRSP